tara:strand:- start:397 stop:660 length:264 start_codon:yes stop_codon:yes gene_type:complete
MRLPQNIVRHELIGLKAKVSKSINPLYKKIKGKVVDETQQTLTIQTTKGEKKVLKRLSTFIFDLNKQKVEVKGSVLIGRAWERIKSK